MKKVIIGGAALLIGIVAIAGHGSGGDSGKTAASPTATAAPATTSSPAAARPLTVTQTPAPTVAPTPVSTPVPPTPKPQPLVFTASGDKKTPTFHISADQWTISYTLQGSDCGFVLGSINVYKPGETVPFDMASHDGCGADSTVEHGSGEFYLDLGVANATMTVTITQQ